MTVFFDHTIVPSTERERSATVLLRILGLSEPSLEEPFLVITWPTTQPWRSAGWDETVEHGQGLRVPR